MKPVFVLIDKAAQQLRGIAENPQREARLLWAHVLQRSYEEIYFTRDLCVGETEEKAFEALLQRRLNHEPLSKILGVREFWSLPFRVTADTLDPRPDSETLIEAVLTLFPEKTSPWRILDLGTGTGCLLLSLLHEYPEGWGVGVDRSKAAIQVAQDNAVRLRYVNRSAFVVGDWGTALAGRFDIILSNPPYIDRSEPLPPEVKNYDPDQALYAEEGGLACYRILAEQIPSLMAPGCKIFFEIGVGQMEAVTSLFLESKAFSLVQAVPDLQGHSRCVVFSRCSG